VSFDRIGGWLRDVVDNIDAIERYVANLSFDQFRQDRMRIDAVERCLQRITEAVIRIGPDAMRTVMPDLPVEQVRGLGNVLRHAYDTLAEGVIWSTIQNDLPPLRRACEEELARRGT
jgi:uncharacterized protein with HEPN domain